MKSKQLKTIKSILVAGVVVVSGAMGSVALAGESVANQSQSVAVVEGPVNINTASFKEIAKALKGIGKRKAKAIVEFREQNGPFKSIEELTQIKGIGKGTLAKNQGKIVL